MPANHSPLLETNIITVTLNPAIDETVFLDQLKPGAVNRARHHHRQAGGKGINISSMLGQFGIANAATGFLGKQNPQLFEQLFLNTGVRDECIRIAGETRTGIKIVCQSTQETTDINFPGASPSAEDLAALANKLEQLARPGRWFLIGGSLPTGVSIEDFILLLKILKNGGASIAVDTHGDALKSAIACGVDLIKPNQDELAGILDSSPLDQETQFAAVAQIQRNGVAHVILSMGSDGALFATPDGWIIAKPPPVQVSSTVGAGDSLLAGYIAGLTTNRPLAECAAMATVFAWCALEHVTRQLPDYQEIEKRIRRIDVRPSGYSDKILPE